MCGLHLWGDVTALQKIPRVRNKRGCTLELRSHIGASCFCRKPLVRGNAKCASHQPAGLLAVINSFIINSQAGMDLLAVLPPEKAENRPGGNEIGASLGGRRERERESKQAQLRRQEPTV